MGGRVSAVVLCAFLIGFGLIAACGNVRAAGAADADIAVVGNRHIGADAIREHFHAGSGGRLDAAALDAC